MKATELRIGNLVYNWYNRNHIEWILNIYDLTEIVKNNHHYKPIPLTEEWLLKFGFISNPYADCYDFNGIKIECDKTRGSLELWCSNITGRITYLTSVHQLQNLYFALTGEELEIK